MFYLVMNAGRSPLTALALTMGIWVLSSSSAMAQGNVGAGSSGGVAGAAGGGSASAGIGGGQMGGGMGGMGHMGPFGMSGVSAGNVGGWGGTGGLNNMTGYGYPPSGMGSGGSGVSPGFYGGGYGATYGARYGGAGYSGYGLSYPYGGGYGMGYSYPYSGFGMRSAWGYRYGGYGMGYGYPSVTAAYGAPTTGFGYSSAYLAPATSAANTAAQGHYLGIDEEPVVDAGGVRGMKVAKVYPGTAAARAGIQVGDVLHSINGYLTQQRGNLAWIIANAAPNNVLEMKVRTARDGQEHTIRAQIL